MNYLEYIVAGVISSMFAGVTWLIRRVLTNEKQIALQEQQLEILKSEIKDRDVRRQEDREIMNEIKTDLKEVKRDILDLYKRDPEAK